MQELVDIFCQEKLISHELIEYYIKSLDEDGNGNVDKQEFFNDFLKNLKVKKSNGAEVTYEDIKKYIEDTEKYPDFDQGEINNSRVNEI